MLPGEQITLELMHTPALAHWHTTTPRLLALVGTGPARSMRVTALAPGRGYVVAESPGRPPFVFALNVTLLCQELSPPLPRPVVPVHASPPEGPFTVGISVEGVSG